MPAAARVGDAISHGGQIIEGSPTVLINGLASARQGDAVICRVHGRQSIVGGSSTVSVDGRAKARMGDAISCGAVIGAGSPNTSTGG